MPLTLKLDVQVPWKPSMMLAPGAMVPLYPAATCRGQWYDNILGEAEARSPRLQTTQRRRESPDQLQRGASRHRGRTVRACRVSAGLSQTVITVSASCDGHMIAINFDHALLS